jgi:hypothetical protein
MHRIRVSTARRAGVTCRSRRALGNCAFCITLLACRSQPVRSSAEAGGVEPVTFEACATDEDCPSVGHFCEPCSDGGASCATVQCVDGGCRETAGFCAGNHPCWTKQCGDDCEQCDLADGGCYFGSCDYFRGCKTSAPGCGDPYKGGTPLGFLPLDARAVGDCNVIVGWAWNGSGCVPLVGCVCQGNDCYDSHLEDAFLCEEAFAGCARDAADGM